MFIRKNNDVQIMFNERIYVKYKIILIFNETLNCPKISIYVHKLNRTCNAKYDEKMNVGEQ